MIRRFLLALALAFALSPSAFAGLDGHASNSGANTTAATVTLTTSLSNDVIVVAVSTARFFGAPPQTVSAVSDVAGLTWAQRSTTGPTIDGNNSARQTVWYAFSPSPLVADVISITLSTAASDASYATSAYGVSNVTNAATAPWDTDVSLPAVGTSITGGHVSVSGVSTAQSNDFIISTFSTRDFFNVLDMFYPSGFTQIDHLAEPTQLAQIVTACQGVAGTTSGVTYTAQTIGVVSNPQILTIDALKGAGSGCGSFVIITPSGGLLLRGVGQ